MNHRIVNQLNTIALLGLLSSIFIATGFILLRGIGGAIVGLIFAGFINFGAWYYSDSLSLAAFSATPVTAEQEPELYSCVQKLAVNAHLPMPKVYLIPYGYLNAFATGRNPHHAAIAVTQGLLKQLPPDELEGVIAHELCHIRHFDTLTITIAATIASAISTITQILSQNIGFLFTRDRHSNSIAYLATLLFAPFAATIIQMSISRTREFDADAGAAFLTGNPRALANALQRISIHHPQTFYVNPAFQSLLIFNPSGDWLFRLFSTHPPVELRIDRLLALENAMNDTFNLQDN
jgi:heat shock protein HtpX